MRAALFWLGLLAAGTARAAPCEAPYTVDQLLADLVGLEQSLRSGDNGGAGPAAGKLEQDLACLNEVLPSMIAGRTYRAIAAGMVAGGDAERGTAWYRTAVDLEGSFEYGLEDMPVDHPARAAFQAARESERGEKVALEGRAFGAGTHYLDGKKLAEPKAHLNGQHLYQRDEGGLLGWVIEGNAFPEDGLVAAAPVVADAGGKGNEKAPKGKAPKEKAPKVAKTEEPKKEKSKKNAPITSSAPGSVVVLERQRPPEKTPLMIGGAAVMLGAGGVYYLSSRSRHAFEEATTQDELQQQRVRTNTLFLVSAGVMAAGAGTLTWGIVLDGGAPSPVLNLRF